MRATPTSSPIASIATASRTNEEFRASAKAAFIGWAASARFGGGILVGARDIVVTLLVVRTRLCALSSTLRSTTADRRSASRQAPPARPVQLRHRRPDSEPTRWRRGYG